MNSYEEAANPMHVNLRERRGDLKLGDEKSYVVFSSRW